MSQGQIAMVVGVGGGLGAALGRRFAQAGMKLALVARGDKITAPLASEINDAGGTAIAYGADTTDEAAVEAMFDQVRSDLGGPDLVAFNAGAFMRTSVLDATAADFERSWRVSCYGGFLVGRAAARGMAARGSGTILFTSATAALRGSANFINLAVGKFGLRALAQSMARELGPQGVHVANMIIDGQINGPAHADMAEEIAAGKLLDPNAIAETYYQIHLQDRSAWTQELDLRPAVEKF
ncbi:MAG: SDR family NAD(P)-dependent oxidoreductase [Alphaproteobacteria bacterium]|jgi:NAD(P)-dependent dehydrogenase (short-subunit alcohol dehydrogenase family)